MEHTVHLLEAGVADGVGDLLALLLGQLPGDGAGHAAAALGHHRAAPGRGRHLALQHRGRGLGSRVTRHQRNVQCAWVRMNLEDIKPIIVGWLHSKMLDICLRDAAPCPGQQRAAAGGQPGA